VSNPYLNELFVNLINLDFYKIPSFYSRIEHYSMMISEVKDAPIMSYGPNKSLSNVGDNIYLFIFFQWGGAGLILQVLPFLMLLFVSFKEKSEQGIRLFLSSLLILLCGAAYETLYNLIYMPIYLYFIADFWSRHKKGTLI
jgi:hypothetical protein